MLLVALGDTVPLALVLGSITTDKYPQARVFDAIGTATPVATLDMVHVSGGYYFVGWTPAAAGTFTVRYTVYDDAGHTTVSTGFDQSAESIVVTADDITTKGGVVRAGYTYDGSSDTITVNVGLEIDDELTQTGVTNATLVLHDSVGGVLATPAAVAAPDAQGIFVFTFAAPTFGSGETATYGLATIDHAGPPARTFKGATYITFVKT